MYCLYKFNKNSVTIESPRGQWVILRWCCYLCSTLNSAYQEVFHAIWLCVFPLLSVLIAQVDDTPAPRHPCHRVFISPWLKSCQYSFHFNFDSDNQYRSQICTCDIRFITVAYTKLWSDMFFSSISYFTRLEITSSLWSTFQSIVFANEWIPKLSALGCDFYSIPWIIFHKICFSVLYLLCFVWVKSPALAQTNDFFTQIIRDVSMQLDKSFN